MRRKMAVLLAGLFLLAGASQALAGPPPPGCLGYEGHPGNNACR